MSKVQKKIRKESKKRSNCWLFFLKTERGGKCRICHREIVSGGNTTNLISHLKRIHTLQWEDALENCHDADDLIDNMEIDETGEISQSDQDSEINELHRATNESLHHAQGLAYQSSDGRTVIWLHPDVQLEQLPADLQTLVEQANAQKSEEGTLVVTGDTGQKDGAAIIAELMQQNDSTCEQQNADTTHLDQPLVVNTEVEIQQENSHTEVIPQIVSVSSSEDHSYVENSVTSSPSKVLVTSVVNNGTLSTLNISKPTLENPTIVSTTPQKIMALTRSQRPILPRPPIKMYPKKDAVLAKVVTSPNEGKSNEIGYSEPNKDSASSGGQIVNGTGGQSNGSAPREDVFDQFGKYVASLLRNLPSKKSASRLQKEILNWVLKEQMSYED